MKKFEPIIGYENSYVVSNDGIVYSLDRLIKLSNGKTRRLKGKVLAATKNSDGYLTVTLSKDSVGEKKYIHRIVAETFIFNPENLPEVDHISGIKSDNKVENLE